MMSKRWMIVLLWGVGVAWYLWTPLPPQLDQRGMVITMAIFKKLTTPLLWLASVLPVYSNMYQPIRGLLGLLTRPLAPDAEPDLQVTDETFSGVKVRVYRPKGAVEPVPVLMFFHGGGWALGSYVSEDRSSRYLARKAKVTVVSVEYRLAPEHPFPAALEDCVTATRHVLTHGSQMGMDPTRVGLHGLSAGGNLVAAVSLRLLDPEFDSLPQPVYQVQLAPCLQGLDLSLPSYTDNNVQVTEAVLSQKDMAQFYLSYAGLDLSPSNVEQVCRGQHIREQTRKKWAKYVHPDLLTGKVTSDRPTKSSGAVNETLASLAEPVLVNPLLSPLLAPDHLLERVPPALLVLSQFDVLRDDGLLYARRLRHLGVEVTWHVIQNGHHISMVLLGSEPGSDVSSQMYDQIVKFISEKSDNLPSQKKSGNLPSQKSDNLPSQKKSDNLPSQKKSDNLPSQKKSDNLPSQKKSDNLPSQKKSDNLPSQKKSDNLPSQKMSDNLPSQKKSDNLPSQKKSDNVPSQKRPDNLP